MEPAEEDFCLLPLFCPPMSRLIATTLRLACTLGLAAVGALAQGSLSSSADYQLRPADILQIQVFQEEDLTREISVSQELTISLPLIGSIDLRGRSVRQAEEIIRQKYDADFLVNPQVTVVVLKYAERTVNVTGAVNQPGAVEFPSERGLTLLDAIARAGGHSRLADLRKVKVTRTSKTGETQTFTVNAGDTQTASLFELQIGDVIIVGERIF
jgi:polysaccharide biosynthesis/export protein